MLNYDEMKQTLKTIACSQNRQRARLEEVEGFDYDVGGKLRKKKGMWDSHNKEWAKGKMNQDRARRVEVRGPGVPAWTAAAACFRLGGNKREMEA